MLVLFDLGVCRPAGQKGMLECVSHRAVQFPGLTSEFFGSVCQATSWGERLKHTSAAALAKCNAGRVLKADCECAVRLLSLRNSTISGIPTGYGVAGHLFVPRPSFSGVCDTAADFHVPERYLTQQAVYEMSLLCQLDKSSATFTF